MRDMKIYEPEEKLSEPEEFSNNDETKFSEHKIS